MKKLRVFAGPNGSGKTTIIQEISSNYYVGSFVNADLIQAAFEKNRFLDYSQFYQDLICKDEWVIFLEQHNRKGSEALLSIDFSEFYLFTHKYINSYDAAIIADFFKSKLVKGSSTFSYETVFSHQSKLDFLKSASKNGFKIYLYFVCTQDPKININRVKNRVLQGGHDVSIENVLAFGPGFYNRYNLRK